MLEYGPTGALSEYPYKGGVFHAVHYGEFHGEKEALFALIEKEEAFVLKSPQKRRILFDLYGTDLTPEVLEHFMAHLASIADHIYKVAFAAEPRELRKLARALKKSEVIPQGFYFISPDQDTDKNWLVGER